MKKGIQILLILLAPFALNAQEVKDSVKTEANANDVFYSFDNGSVKSRTAKDWHIAFEISGFSGSIRVNGPAGVKLYRTPFAVADFAKFDSAGASNWEELLNSTITWSAGAFNTDPKNDFDLGWGNYNPSTHIVSGDSIYLMMLPDGSYKKIYIDKLASSKYYFKHADLDGSNEKTDEVDKADFGGKVFGYFNLSTGKSLDSEPMKKDWDLLFTKYVDLVYQGPTPTPYPLSGVLTNQGVEVAQREGVDVTDNDTSKLNWTDEISTIGSDWKKYNFPMNRYDITEDLSYFVRTNNGAVWKIYFTAYSGGNFHFTKELIKASASSSSIELKSLVTVYPNPSLNGIYKIDNQLNSNNAQFKLSNIEGKTILEGSLNSINELDLSNEKSGLYFLNLIDGNSQSSKVLIKK